MWSFLEPNKTYKQSAKQFESANGRKLAMIVHVLCVRVFPVGQVQLQNCNYLSNI